MATSDRLRFEEPLKVQRERSTRAKREPSTEQTPLSDAESILDEHDGKLREGDFKSRQTFKGWTLAWLAYQSIGIVYGDIGTSPLYVFSSTFEDAPPSRQDVLGALSLIIWSITLMVSIKYVWIVLYADDEGEGGTFAIYSLLTRYSNITKFDPKTRSMTKVERYHVEDMPSSNLKARTFIERNTAMRTVLKSLAVLGISFVMADSILTPAQSVLGAIQGLRVVASDNINTDTIVGVSCAVIVLLFLVQPIGVSKIGCMYAPIITVWLLFNCAFGIYNLVVHDWTVLKAFSPYHAGHFFVRKGTLAWLDLNGILLSFTGVEALFADLGAFSARAIRLSWFCFAFPCILLSYIGQAAYLSEHPEDYLNPFFKAVPPGLFWPTLILATLAAIVASQAIITSAFQLLSQAMSASYFPQLQVIHTDKRFHGQVFIPVVNWLMMIATVIVTAVYNTTTRLGHAYGVCVILVTFITTCLVSLVAIVVWRLNWILVLAVWLPFITFEGLFLTSALTKFPDGAWFTLLLAAILSSIFILWRYGKEVQWDSESRERSALSDMIVKGPDGSLKVAARYGGATLTNIRGLGIFFDKSGDQVPVSYEEFLRKFQAHPEVHVFLHLRALQKPHVPDEEKYSVVGTSFHNCYRLTIRYGYNDSPMSADLGRLVYTQVKRAISRFSVRDRPSGVASARSLSPASNMGDSISVVSTSSQRRQADIAQRLEALDRAFNAQVVYIVGKQQLRTIKENHNWSARLMLRVFIWLKENTRPKIAKMRIPIDKLVEVGFVKEI
ncbi:potassium uptake protein [Pseudovirgaria hyperparasitica]|uniref:Potassium uptake protein n=1 Tax=Pseudovirgaria hyperparasitica TaxID=470096 RepID=A0A6A6VYR9_9PEZI|nr:potassium uptake protein [Pseudovirgaria hyperparasitica]KAF2754457.1 potassium uptake protein [Pseudovirgaria hyperparasitica]